MIPVAGRRFDCGWVEALTAACRCGSLCALALLLLTLVVAPPPAAHAGTPPDPLTAPAAVSTTGARSASPSNDLWVIVKSGTSQDLHGVCFVDRLHGWAVGDKGTIIATSDGGDTWTSQSSGTRVVGFTDVSFADTRNGWAVGPCGWVVHTTDGGVTWSRQHFPYGAGDIGGVSAVGPSAAFIAGFDFQQSPPPFVCRTTDGGAQWGTVFNHGGYNLYDICAVDASKAWAVGSTSGYGRGAVLATTDGGATWWAQSASTARLVQLMAVDFADASTGWAVGTNGDIRATCDGGNSWATQNRGSDWWTGVAAVTRQDAWICGQDGIIATQDWGWHYVLQEDYPTNDVCFVDAAHGWAVSDKGYVLQYSPDPIAVALTGASKDWQPFADLTAAASCGFGLWVTSMQYRIDGGAWREIPGAGPTRTLGIGDAGQHLVEVFCTDTGGQTSNIASATVFIDPYLPHPLPRPTPAPGFARVIVQRGHKATIRYRVRDTMPERVHVWLQILRGPRRASGVPSASRSVIVRTVYLGRRPTGTLLTARFRCPPSVGAYRYRLIAIASHGRIGRYEGGRLVVR